MRDHRIFVSYRKKKSLKFHFRCATLKVDRSSFVITVKQNFVGNIFTFKPKFQSYADTGLIIAPSCFLSPPTGPTRPHPSASLHLPLPLRSSIFLSFFLNFEIHLFHSRKHTQTKRKPFNVFYYRESDCHSENEGGKNDILLWVS